MGTIRHICVADPKEGRVGGGRKIDENDNRI